MKSEIYDKTHQNERFSFRFNEHAPKIFHTSEFHTNQISYTILLNVIFKIPNKAAATLNVYRKI